MARTTTYLTAVAVWFVFGLIAFGVGAVREVFLRPSAVSKVILCERSGFRIIGRMKPPPFVRPLSEPERQAIPAGLRSPDAFTLRRAQILKASAEG
ncbi:MAG: hypothetical protein JO034_10815, partial [Singulisphaera sp.]|nr:hypothetical protein [Singulisphaera sp.]